MFTNLYEIKKEPVWFGRTLNAFTNLFKTYATLTPRLPRPQRPLGHLHEHHRRRAVEARSTKQRGCGVST